MKEFVKINLESFSKANNKLIQIKEVEMTEKDRINYIIEFLSHSNELWKSYAELLNGIGESIQVFSQKIEIVDVEHSQLNNQLQNVIKMQTELAEYFSQSIKVISKTMDFLIENKGNSGRK